MSDADLTELVPDSFGDRIGRAAVVAPRFSWSASLNGAELRVALGGVITLEEAAVLWRRVAELLEPGRRHERVLVDLAAVDVIDGACLALLVHLRTELRHRRVQCELEGGSAEVRRLITLYGRRRVRRRPRR
ncbi:MAG: STAS domain-containing protein, partial [Polyangiaceae bacterium]